MANLIGKIGASVFEVSNRVAIQTGDELFSEVVDRADNHESKLNTEAHQINNISGLQTALDSKQDIISGYTGNISVVVSVDFMAQTVTSKTVNVSNGIITSID